MGREVRRVPPNWVHPIRDPKNDRYGHGGYQPMYDTRFDAKFAEWLGDFDRIRAGGLTDFERECCPRGLADWLQDEGRPPNPAYYRVYKDEDATWFQVYETVSEGTPVTPPFVTQDELVDYLVFYGDFWQQKRWKEGSRFMQPDPPGYDRINAEKFVKGTGCAPSMTIISGADGIPVIKVGI